MTKKTDAMIIRFPHELVPIDSIKPNPENPNIHTEEQIVELALSLKEQGWRKPVVISNQSGLCNTGHGCVLAAKRNGWTHVPVSYQDFDSPEQEYAYLCADNALNKWSNLDFKMINMKLPELGPDFEIRMLGIKDFALEPLDAPNIGDFADMGGKKMKFYTCPNCEEEFEEKQAQVRVE